MAIDPRGKTIIITGASSGIGAATAIEAGRQGMNVVVAARRKDRLEAVAQQTEEAGGRAVVFAGDVIEPGFNDALLSRAAEAFGGFDVVFANAGYGLERETIALEMDELRRIFEVNLFASVDLIQRAARGLIEQDKPGHLLMCSSCLARFSLPGYAPYSATKAAQAHVCQAMDAELRRRYGIRVTSVHPITTDTEFFAAVKRANGVVDDQRTVPEHAPRFFVQRPEQVARAVLRCLRRPRSQVWTSHIVRIVAGLMVMFPWFADRVMASQARFLRSD